MFSKVKLGGQRMLSVGLVVGLLLTTEAFLNAASIVDYRYNEVRQKSSHNSFQKDESILDQLVYHRIRSLEFDVHHSKKGDTKYVSDWFVYHVDVLDDDTSCRLLSDCLNILRAFHQANPNHEVVTVWIDLKDPFTEDLNHNPYDFDRRIRQHVDPSWIWKPADLMSGCATTTLKDALRNCGWPYLSRLRGKFIFVLTGDNSKLDSYVRWFEQDVDIGSKARTAFIAPDLKNANEINQRDYAIFYNINEDERGVARDVWSGGFVSRVWKANDEGTWNSVKSYNAHHIATDKINFHKDPWAKTHIATGWPFERIRGTTDSSLREPGNIILIDVNSEDIRDTSDSFYFRNTWVGVSDDWTTWEATVYGANSHIEEWARGCFMVRESLAANSPYFGVCRPADNHKLRIQYRTCTSCSTVAYEVDIPPSGVDQTHRTFIKLVHIYNSSQNTTYVYGYGSLNPSSNDWTYIGMASFRGYTLRYQGLATSSHGNKTVRWMFGNVTRNGLLQTTSSLPGSNAIGGSVRYAAAYDGIQYHW